MITVNVFATGNQTRATSFGPGILGVNITYQGKYRTLSNAHVFTQYDQDGIGNMIRYRPDPSNPYKELYPVTGQVIVTYYTNPNEQNPVFNVKDVAWGDVTSGSHVSTTIHAADNHHIYPSGEVRAPKGEEHFMLGNYRLYASHVKITSLITKSRTEGHDSSGAIIYSWWSNCIKYSNPGTHSGDSGTAMVATSDNDVIGLHRSSSGVNGYGCPIA